MKKKLLAITMFLTISTLAACSPSDQIPESITPETTATEEVTSEDGHYEGDGHDHSHEMPVLNKTGEPIISSSDLPQLNLPSKGSGDTIAVISTSMGDITVVLYPEYAPLAVENFVTLASDGYYDNLTFHRVMDNFMIQGGDPNGTGTGGQSMWGAPFEDEFDVHLHNFRGSLAMANSGPNTNGSQFFINQNNELSPDVYAYMEETKNNQDYLVYESELGEQLFVEDFLPTPVVDEYLTNGGNVHLDYIHTVFGQVVEGLDVVDAIAKVPVNSQAMPEEPVIINTITISTY